jgi:EAL domain-containing protein (putative c-di-GMP-specific phosphodiesterase class I)
MPMPYLERHPEPGGPVERIAVHKLPFTIGRGETADHVIYSNKVSKEHATIVATGDGYVLRDLQSTNGTFVNGQRIEEHQLADGDIIHVAHVEFCFRAATQPAQVPAAVESAVERTDLVPSREPGSLIRGTELLRQMIRTEAVEIVYQPIVDLQSRTAMGYEALGRGSLPGLSASPAILFALAEQCGLAVELSQLSARLAVLHCDRLPPGAKLFVNVHARELDEPGLIEWLTSLRQLAPPDRQLVVEIAESSVTDVAAMIKNRDGFRALGLEFAYDDFGAGQARLVELADVPPDYLKIDRVIVQGIDTSSGRQDMVGALVNAVKSLGVQIIAEGIETEEVARTCAQLGCQLGQGFLLGRPEPA